MKVFKLMVFLSLVSSYLTSGQSLKMVDGKSDTIAYGNALTTSDIAAYAKITNIGTDTIQVLVKRIDKNYNRLTDSNAICWQVCFGADISVSPPRYAITLDPGDTTDVVKGFNGHVYPNKDGVPMSGDITYVFFDLNNPSDSVTHTITYEVNTTFDVPELNQRERLAVYPNPARDNLTLEYDLTGLSSASFELVNVVGNVVYRRDLPAEVGNIDLNISKLNRGVYFYVLRNGGDSLITRKLVIQ